MNLKIPKEIKFSNYYKKFNFLSFILILSSIVLLFIKGLNFGVDFKGGTLIELRVDKLNVKISDIRYSLLKMELGDVTVKKFGKEGDYLLKLRVQIINLILLNRLIIN